MVSPELFINLTALRENYRLLTEKVSPALIAPVIKADGYGLGVEKMFTVLSACGAKLFFVATANEALALPPRTERQRVAVLNGFSDASPGDLELFQDKRLIPVLNSYALIESWAEFARRNDCRLPAILHIDTAMSRLGLHLDEVAKFGLGLKPALLSHLDILYVISHLSSADMPSSPTNKTQLSLFRHIRKILTDYPASLANSSGIFLGADYHFDMARPGAALYGINPTPNQKNPMRPVIRLEAPILQIRTLKKGEATGYGGTWHAKKETRIAIVGCGYADGYPRSASNRARGWLAGEKIMQIGTVSMDSAAFDISHLPEDIAEGAKVTLIGENYTVDDFADDCQTIGYEVLTSLAKKRVVRNYKGE